MGKKTEFRNRIGLAAACCLAAWWAACSVMERPKDIEKISRLGASMHARFGLKLFGELVRENPGENIFISPLSAAMSLGAVYNGAGGETAAEISQAMQIPGTPVEELNRASAELLESTRQLDPQARLTEGNSLWGCHIRFKPEFLNRVRRAHRAEVKAVDFADPGAAAAINAWVREKTDGRIEKLVSHISPDAVLVLLNAVYFKGAWSVEFKKSMTRERSFTRLDGSTKKHPMMHQAGAYDYLETDVFQAVSLPYGDGRMSLYVFVPRRILGLGEFYKTLDEARWAGWLSRFEKKEGHIALPKFRLEYAAGLNRALQALGMRAAFDHRKADFKNMGDPPAGRSIFIDSVLHKTFVEVNEEGTEAAAATAVTGLGREAIGEDKFNVVADHPFFCVIRDNRTGANLFMGSIVDPT